MRHNPSYAVTDPEIVRTLIRENPWATIVSHAAGELVASHYPVLLDEDSEQLAVFTHVGRPDEAIHALGTGEVLLIIAGRHGYISPSWYAEGKAVAPTWNFSTVHAYGTPQLLDPEENLRVLTRLTDHFEQHVDEPFHLDPVIAEKVAQGTVGVRLPIDRFICKVKMSEDKDPVSRQQVLEHLRRPGGPYADPPLADDMERAWAWAAARKSNGGSPA